MALKKAAKILSERSSEYRSNSSSRKRKSEPTAEDPPQQKLDELLQSGASTGAGAQVMEQQPQANAGQMLGYQAAYGSWFPGGADHLRQAAASASALGLAGDNQRLVVEGGLTQANLTQGETAAPGSLLPVANLPEGNNLTPGGHPRDRSEGQASGATNTQGDDESPGSISQDASAVGEVLPSAADLSGVFTSSSSEARAKDSSPSTDES